MDNSDRVILLVEDEDDDVFLFQRALVEVQIVNPIQVAVNGVEAVNYLSGEGPFADREKYPLPLLILLDLKMPRMPGFEVLRWIKRRRILIPVIVFTSSANAADVKAAYEAGAASFVVKPLNIDARRKFATLIRDYWLGTNVFVS